MLFINWETASKVYALEAACILEGRAGSNPRQTDEKVKYVFLYQYNQ